MNAFTKKIVAKKTDSSTKSAKGIADVSEEIKTKVDQYVDNKASIKQLEAEQAGLEVAIIDHVRPQQDEMAYRGSFTKSMTVAGNTAMLTYVTMDKFTVPQDEETLKALRDLVGKDKYNEMFETKEVYSIKPEIAKDDKKMNALATVCEKAGIDIVQYFDRSEKVIAKTDLDRKQYELKSDKLEIFRTHVRQAKPSLK
jgi:gas vesicle protein